MENKGITVVITLVVGIILAGSLLVPVLKDASASADTITNDGYYEMKKYTPADDVVLTWDYADPAVFIVNGETIPFENNTEFAMSVMLGAPFAVRCVSGNLTCQFYGNGSYVTGNETYPNVTVTYSGGQINATNGTASKAISNVDQVYCIASSGDYVMKDSNKPAYLKTDSEIFATGLTWFGSQVLVTNIVGDVENLTYTLNAGYTLGDKTVNYSEDAIHLDTIKLDNIVFDVTNPSGVHSTVTFSYFVVPHEIIADRTNPLDSSSATILMVIPIIFIVSLLVVAVSAVRAKNN